MQSGGITLHFVDGNVFYGIEKVYEPGEYFVLWNHIFPVLGEFDTNDVAFRWYVLGGRFSRKWEIS
jgi:hypothetical protein